jgi:thioredoxin 2
VVWAVPPDGAGFAAVAALVEPHLRLGKVDTELEQALAVRFGIQSIPSLILVEKGQQIARTAGAMPETALLQWIESAMAARRRHYPAHSIGGNS